MAAAQLRRGLILAAAAWAVCGPTAAALDMQTIEYMLKDVSESPCRVELLALGMSLVNAHGCASSMNSWDEMGRCNDKIFDFLDVGGQILKKEKCADPLAQVINKKIVNIDMKPIFKIFVDLYECTQTHGDIAPCREQAVPGLVKIGSQFANELLDGLTPKTEQLAVTTLDAQVVLGGCLATAPHLNALLSESDYQAFKASAQPLLDQINEFRAAPTKQLLDSKQQWIVDRLLELLSEKSPVSVQSTKGLKAEDLRDIRKCSNEWTAFTTSLGSLIKSDDVQAMHMRVFERIPLLNPLRPWYEAFFDNVDEFSDSVLPATACLTRWASSAELNQCTADIARVFQQFVQHAEASEKQDLDADVHNGWSEDQAFLSQRPVPTAAAPAEVSTISTLQPPPIRTYTPDPVVPTYTPDPVAPTYTPATTALPDEPPTPKELVNSSGSRGSSIWSVLWKTTLSAACIAGLCVAALRLRSRGVFARAQGYTGIKRSREMDDAESQTLLNEFSDSDEEDDEPLVDL